MAQPKEDSPYKFTSVPRTTKKPEEMLADVERQMGAQVTENTLSSEQRDVFDAVCAWYERARGSTTLTLGGYAGCLSGETALAYSRGTRVGHRPITLRDLYLKFNGYRGSGRGAAQRWVDSTVPTYLLSLWPDGTAAYNRVVAVFESGRKAVLRVSFDDGNHLVLTADHPIATPDGFVAAGELAVGDAVLGRGSLRPVDEGKGRRPLDLRPPRVIVNTKYHPGAVKTVTCNGVDYAYVRVPRARLVVEAAMNDLPYGEFVHALKKNEAASAGFKFLPREVDVHHLDEDTLNDDISNLGVLPHAEHARVHTTERNAQVEYVREVRVVSIEPAPEEMTYDVQMEPPANNFVANGIFVHNTGKTTLVSVLANHFSHERIAFCAYTGKAASVLRKKFFEANVNGQHEIKTIHSLMYYPIVDEYSGVVRGWKRRNDLGCDLIVVDEASMLDAQLYEDLGSYGIPILAVGDHGQLPPVRGNFNLMAAPALRLETIHRQAQGSPILALSEYVRRTGQVPRMENSLEVQILDYDQLDSVVESLFTHPGVRYDDVGLLAFSNRERCALNDSARYARWGAGKCPALSVPLVGDQVICLKNVDGTVFNGMRGTITALDPKYETEFHYYGKVLFEDDEIEVEGPICKAQFGQHKTIRDFNEYEELTGFRVTHWRQVGLLFDYGYAMTIHKSQGSQLEHAIVVNDFPARLDDDTRRRALYTAVTRASKYLVVLE